MCARVVCVCARHESGNIKDSCLIEKRAIHVKNEMKRREIKESAKKQYRTTLTDFFAFGCASLALSLEVLDELSVPCVSSESCLIEKSVRVCACVLRWRGE